MTGTQHYDLIIIGGGPAGQGAAEFAAFAGRRILAAVSNPLDLSRNDILWKFIKLKKS